MLEMDIKTISETIKKEILKYPSSKKCPLLDYRIRVLQYGKTKTESTKVIYTVEEIWTAYQMSHQEISNCFETIEFKNEKHMINTILLIMTKNIDEAKNQIQSKKNNSNKIQSLDNSVLFAGKSKYVRKTKQKNFKEDLWNG